MSDVVPDGPQVAAPIWPPTWTVRPWRPQVERTWMRPSTRWDGRYVDRRCGVPRATPGRTEGDRVDRDVRRHGGVRARDRSRADAKRRRGRGSAVAHELGLLTTPYVFSSADAVAMTEAGADVVVCHLGLTTGGSITATTSTVVNLRRS